MIYTFYSYKGGVGRSMALVNVATLMHRAGLNVLMVDWDLEAPGLERFFPDHVQRALKNPGVINMLSDYKKEGSRFRPDSGQSLFPVYEIEDYLVPIHRQVEGNAQLRLLPAGRRVGEEFLRYSNQVKTFDWQDFYDNWEGEIYFEWLREELVKVADVVLIDSRTGVTEMGGVCTYQLADTVVMFCGANEQNIDGTLQMLTSFADPELHELRQRPLNTLVVPARIERSAELKSLAEFRQDFTERFRRYLFKELQQDPDFFIDLEIPYFPLYAFEEIIAVDQEKDSERRAVELEEAYARLLQLIVGYAPKDSRIFERLSQTAPADTEIGSREFPEVPADDYVSEPLCPYPGMVPFTAEDARFFYGRTSEINTVLKSLRSRRRLFIIGPSGSGKSSLFFAGVLPKLPESAYFRHAPWLVRTMRPGAQPLAALSHCLEGDPAQLGQTVPHLLVNQPTAKRLLLVVDQFEELFTLAAPEERVRFIEALQELQTVPDCALVILLRADFYQDLMNSALWPVKLTERLEVGPLRGDALRQAISQPAEDVGVKLEEGLVERLVADAADEPGALPLVQETLVQLWELMENDRLTLYAYEQLSGDGRSGLAEAIAYRAEAVLDEFTASQLAIARRIFLRLVQFGEGRAHTRRQQLVANLRSIDDDPALFDQTLRRLVDNRLLILSGKEGSEDVQVDIAHEALFDGWPTLQNWVSERLEAERTRRRLEAKVEEWVRLGQGDGGLLDEVELLEAERWLESSDAADVGYNKDLLALIQASRNAIERVEREKENAIAANRHLTLLGIATAAIQHRINNTLNIIGPNITRLRKRVDLEDETIREIFDIIERNIRYTSTYIQRIQNPLKDTTLQTVDINASLRDAQAQVWQQYQDVNGFGQVRIQYELDDSLPLVSASVGHITEIFRNLIENSCKAMASEGGTLTVISRRVDDWLEVEIRDTGPGIAPEIRDQLFEKPVPYRYSSQETHGSGLGLWLSVLLLKRYAGKIKIADTGPQGTTMLVRLPISNVGNLKWRL